MSLAIKVKYCAQTTPLRSHSRLIEKITTHDFDSGQKQFPGFSFFNDYYDIPKILK